MVGGDDYLDVVNAFNARADADRWPMRADPGLGFAARSVNDALAVWHAKAGDRPMPTRANMAPRAMKNFLPKVAIIDVVRAPQRLRFRGRVVGTDLARTFGDQSGFFDESLPEPFLSRWEGVMKLALDAGAPVRTINRVEYRNMTYLQVEALYAPLGEDWDAPDAVFMAAQISASAGAEEELGQAGRLSARAALRAS